jgi:hypothetical protein
MKKLFLLLFGLALAGIDLNAQGFAWGLKAGPSLGFQLWEPPATRGGLLGYHGAVYIESLDLEERYALYAQLGYHLRGSTVRFQFIDFNTGERFQEREPYSFGNLALQVGAKQKFGAGRGGTNFFYLLGLRGEYNLTNNLPKSSDEIFYHGGTLFDEFVRDFVFGASVGGGVEFPFSDYVGGMIEISVHPDFSKQFDQQGDLNLINPFFPQNRVLIPARGIRNLTLELTLAIRFLRIYEYE